MDKPSLTCSAEDVLLFVRDATLIGKPAVYVTITDTTTNANYVAGLFPLKIRTTYRYEGLSEELTTWYDCHLIALEAFRDGDCICLKTGWAGAVENDIFNSHRARFEQTINLTNLRQG